MPYVTVWLQCLILAGFLHLFILPLSAQEPGHADTICLDEVEVVGSRIHFYPLDHIPSRRFQSLPVRDIGDMLRHRPNVSGIRKGGVGIDPVVRGFKYSQVAVVLDDGVKIEGGCPNRMDPVASHVESENLRSVEVIRGPYLLHYGPVSGALINLKTIQPVQYQKPTLHGEFLWGFETNWNGQREHVALYGGNRTVFFNLSAGMKVYGSYKAGNGEQYPSSFKKYYGTAGLGFVPAPGHTLTAGWMFDQGEDVLFPALPMDERLDRTHSATLRYNGQFSGKSLNAIEFLAWVSPVHHVMDNSRKPSAKNMKAETTVDALNAGGRLLLSWKRGAHQVQSGLDLEHIWKNGNKIMAMTMVMEEDTFTSVSHTNVWLDAVTDNAGLSGSYRYLNGNTDLTVSLRVDYNTASSSDTFRLVHHGISYFDEMGSSSLNVSATAGLVQKINHRMTLQAGIGRGTRSPSVLERFIRLMPVQYDSYDYIGNPQLKPETNHQADLGLTLLLSEWGSVKVSGFASMLTDYITGVRLPLAVIKPATLGSPGVKQFSNEGNAYLYGWEAQYRSSPGRRWYINASVAGTWGTVEQSTRYLLTDGQVTGEEVLHFDPVPEIPPLEGSLSFSCRFYDGSLVPGLELRMVAPQNRVSVSYGEQKTPGFLTMAINISWAPWRFFTLNAGISNLFNTPYYEHLNRRIIGSESRLYEPGRFAHVTARFKF